MRLRLIYSGELREVELPWEVAKALIEELKRGGARFDPGSKTWTAERVPCGVADVFKIGECQEGRFWKSFYYVKAQLGQDELKRLFCYKVARWKVATCGEYCEEKCADAFDPDRCVDKCEERCEEEGWTPRIKVEEKVCLYRVEDGEIRVPRGLALRLTDRVKYADLPQLELDPRLRDYQAEVARSVWSQLGKIGAATVQMATGAGKSFLSGFLAKRLEEAGYKVFVTALQLDLIYQLRDFARQFGANPTAVTVQTLWNRLRKAGIIRENGLFSADEEEEGEILKAYSDETPDAPDDLAEQFAGGKAAVIVDEVHHLPARTVKAVAMAAGGGEALRIGLSATPWRNDGRDLEIYAYMGEIVEPRISSSYLIERGYAVPVTVRMVRAGEWGCFGDSFSEVRKCLAESEERNRFIAELVRKAPKPALVITPLVKHAETLADVVKDADSKLRVEAVTGAVKGEKRREIYDALKNGAVDVLVATTLADEGLDLPPLRSLVNALGGRSKTRTLQRVGRLVRPWPGKDSALAIDVWDRAEHFADQGKARLELYKSEPAWRIEIIERNHVA
ncbi:DEAD/DEAH box helicase family protein [Thermofilum sp.]|uniref:DEAD/DEAH box helicase family protein n=1 Tax=Thermofilum sp. TaxID=1961369 RepID=UPI00317476D6